MLLEITEKLVYFGIPGILLATPADITGWSILHSATLIPAIHPGDSKPFFFFFFTFYAVIFSNMSKGCLQGAIFLSHKSLPDWGSEKS